MLVDDVTKKLIAPHQLSKIYIGKTDDIKRRCVEHQNEGLPYTLELISGKPKDISELEEGLIKTLQKTFSDKVANATDKSLGNGDAHCLYVSFAADIESDSLCEYDEKFFLGKEYPFNLNDN